MENTKKVAIIMGSDSDWPTVKAAAAQLKSWDIPFEVRVMGAHRTPAAAAEFAKRAAENGFGVIIAAAGMAAHLAGSIAANTVLPVVGIPVKGGAVDGLDALLATVQMPSGIPVATVALNGAKNAAVAIIPAALLVDGVCRIENIPQISDVTLILQILRELGADVRTVNRTTVDVDCSHIRNRQVPYELARKIRASYYLVGALLGRFGWAEVPLPGGCDLGGRPIDQHIKGFKALGCTYSLNDGMIEVSAKELRGAHIYLDMVTVGATMNIILAAVKAKGLTVIENAAREPHVVDLANFLNSMGANISGAGTDVIKIRGVEHLKGITYSIIPDQIEAGTFMFAAAATGGDITVKNVIPKHLEATTAKLEEIGCEVEEFDDAVRVRSTGRLHRTHVKTLPYPGYPTDMQPQIAVTLALAEGTSIVTESIFENRFKYADELSRMGANIKVEGNSAIIDGVKKLTGARVSAPDLRAGAALVIAGLAADGITIVDDIVYIQRGYENFEEKLRSLGAEIERVSSEKEIQKFRLRVG